MINFMEPNWESWEDINGDGSVEEYGKGKLGKDKYPLTRFSKERYCATRNIRIINFYKTISNSPISFFNNSKTLGAI